MICILTMNEQREIKNWIIATDYRDALRQANVFAVGHGAGSPAVELVGWLADRRNIVPQVGKTILPTGHMMLVN